MPKLPPNSEVIFGIRPEKIFGAPQPSAASIEAEIVQVEPLGAETIFACRIGEIEKPVFARVGPDVMVKVGERGRLGVDLAAAHVFDADGNALHGAA